MKLGFVGFGAQAQQNIVPSCQILPGVDIAAICDHNETRRAEARRWLRFDAVFSDYRQMIEECDLDALIVACYPTEHCQIATYALERRLPVFVEKPPAPSSQHLRAMIELAAREGCTTGVGMNFRYASVTRRMKSLIGGELDSITLRHFCNKPTQPFWNHTSLVKSFLYSQSIHSIDFLIDLCGPVRNISVFGNRRDSMIVMTIVLSFESGANASLVTSNTSPHFVFDFDAICMGSRHISSSALWQLGVSDVGKTYAHEETKRWSDSWAHSPLDSGFERSGYAGQMTEFLNAVREQRDSAISFASILETYRCLDEIELQMARKVDYLARKAS